MGSFTSDRPSPGDQIIEKDDDGDDEEKMNQAPGHLEDYPPKKPGNNQNDREPYHGITSRGSVTKDGETWILSIGRVSVCDHTYREWHQNPHSGTHVTSYTV
jgi:hypothetical protein